VVKLNKPLREFTRDEWEDLCDGCGRCCMVKLEDADTGDLAYTNVGCEYLDPETCRCRDYTNRAVNKPECMVLGPDRLQDLAMLPTTCAYRLQLEGRTLDPREPEISMRGRFVSEQWIHEDQLPEHIVDWITT
jgi:uncharacterized cysteine cluster protein YcgN (CxxCxxCC family)